MDEFSCLSLQSHYEEAVYFLEVSEWEFQLAWSNSEGWKVELTLVPPSGLNTGHLDWESSTITTRLLLHDLDYQNKIAGKSCKVRLVFLKRSRKKLSFRNLMFW